MGEGCSNNRASVQDASSQSRIHASCPELKQNNQKKSNRKQKADFLLGVAELITTVLNDRSYPSVYQQSPFFNTFVFPAMPRMSVNEEPAKIRYQSSRSQNERKKKKQNLSSS